MMISKITQNNKKFNKIFIEILMIKRESKKLTEINQPKKISMMIKIERRKGFKNLI